jgi:hypothetical protein
MDCHQLPAHRSPDTGYGIWDTGYGYLLRVEFTGTIYFDFESADSWRLFALTVAAERERVAVSATWRGFMVGRADEELTEPAEMGPGERALAAHAAVFDLVRQRRLREALFTLVHRQGDSLEDELTYRAAAKVAGLDGDVLLDAIDEIGFRTLVQGHRTALASGVTATPSIVRNGPPLLVTTTPAIQDDRARPRLEIIDRMLADDGLWGLVKP